jgi:hypothetical protein
VRFGFVMAGLGAACAFGVVSNRVTVLGTRIGGHYELSSQQEDRRTPGVDLATRDSGSELIDIGLRLDQLDVLPGQLDPFRSFAPGGPPPNLWSPFQTQQSGLSFGDGGASVGGLVVAGGAAAGVIAQAQTLPPAAGAPADPQPDAPPAPVAFGGSGQPLDPVLLLPPGLGPPAPGGPPPPGGVDPGPVPPPTTGPPPPAPLGPQGPLGPPLPSPPVAPIVVPGAADTSPPAFAAPPDGPAGPAGAIPEPAAWSAMLMGFGIAGHALRRRRKAREYAC